MFNKYSTFYYQVPWISFLLSSFVLTTSSVVLVKEALPWNLRIGGVGQNNSSNALLFPRLSKAFSKVMRNVSRGAVWLHLPKATMCEGGARLGVAYCLHQPTNFLLFKSRCWLMLCFSYKMQGNKEVVVIVVAERLLLLLWGCCWGAFFVLLRLLLVVWCGAVRLLELKC